MSHACYDVALVLGPVAIAVAKVHRAFKLRTNRLYIGCCCAQVFAKRGMSARVVRGCCTTENLVYQLQMLRLHNCSCLIDAALPHLLSPYRAPCRSSAAKQQASHESLPAYRTVLFKVQQGVLPSHPYPATSK
jgi:hypothetical protein